MYAVPSLEELTGFLMALGKALLPSRAMGARLAYYGKLWRTVAAGATDNHAALRTAQRDAHPLTARGAAQDDWLGLVGIPRLGATGATKDNALRIRGNAGANWTTADTLTHKPSGQQYRPLADGAIPGVAPLWFDVGVEAIGTGSATRLVAGDVLTFDAPPANIKATAELQLDLDEGGWDVEPDGAALVRLIARMSKPSSGGNVDDIIGWARAVEGLGIGKVYVYRGRPAIGHVDVAALHQATGAARALSAPERDTLYDALIAQAPGQMSEGALRVLETVEEIVNVKIRLVASQWDFGDGGGMAVASYDAGSMEVTTVEDLPSDFAAGVRVSVDGADQDGAPLVVDAITGADSFTLRDEPSAVIDNTMTIRASGDAAIAARAAIVAHLNGSDLFAGPTGPITEENARANPTIDITTLHPLVSGIGTANPDARYEMGGIPWVGGVYGDKLAAIAAYVPGVQRALVDEPAEPYEATDYAVPLDGKIGFVSPGSVLVYRNP